jgi:hypothetical protein
MTTIRIITKECYNQLMEYERYYDDCTGRVDLKALKSTLKSKKTIKKVVVLTRDHCNFKNVANKDITYKYPCCASSTDDGMFYENYGGYRMPSVINPLGDAFVVI